MTRLLGKGDLPDVYRLIEKYQADGLWSPAEGWPTIQSDTWLQTWTNLLDMGVFMLARYDDKGLAGVVAGIVKPSVYTGQQTGYEMLWLGTPLLISDFEVECARRGATRMTMSHFAGRGGERLPKLLEEHFGYRPLEMIYVKDL